MCRVDKEVSRHNWSNEYFSGKMASKTATKSEFLIYIDPGLDLSLILGCGVFQFYASQPLNVKWCRFLDKSKTKCAVRQFV